MLTILDRYILRALLINYGIALAVMVSLYVVLDLFVNMDEFTEQGYALPTVIRNIVDYYAPNLLLYFAQLSGVITLFACLASLARMRKFNELTAVLASGVSLHRVAAPIITFGLVSTALLVIDSEWLIPAVAHRLARDRDDDFVVLLQETSRATAVTVTTRMLMALSQVSVFSGDEDAPPVTMSVAIACFPDDADTPRALLSRVLSDLEQAKRDSAALERESTEAA